MWDVKTLLGGPGLLQSKVTLLKLQIVFAWGWPLMG